MNNLVQKKKELVEERNKLNIEERQIIRLINESKATGKVVLGEFSNAKKELLPEYQRMQIELKELKKVKE